MSGHRWSKFWWQDWRNDPGLRSCSIAARGLWIELLCIMHDSERTGYLQAGGLPLDCKSTASQVGVNPRMYPRLLAELERAGVFSRTPDGIIFSRRMSRDAAASEQGREYGKRGGNPDLLPKDDDAKPAQGVNPPSYPPNGGGGLREGVNPPGYPQGLKGGVKPEAEADSEAEAEGRKRQEKDSKTLPSDSQAAREANEGAGTDRGEFDAYLDRLREVPADRAAAHNAARKVVRALDGRRGQRTLDQAYRPPKASAVQMAAEVVRGDVVAELDPVRERQEARDPVRSVEQMIAALGVSAEAMARSRQMAAARFGLAEAAE